MSDPITNVPLALSAESYDILIGEGILQRSGELASRVLKPCRCAVITDDVVGPLHAKTLLDSLRESGFEADLLTIPTGEHSKSMAVASDLCDRLIGIGLDRKSALFALGGGVVGDLAGFVASIYYRGIPVIQVPTSVVAQIDSAIGGKTGVNSPLGKNLIGTFHQPRLVIADTSTLTTLPEDVFREGLAEAVKHSVIADAEMLEILPPSRGVDLSPLIARNASIKARIVSEDEFETTGRRALLNFGHTIGHAIESTAGYGTLSHGEAVAIGMIAALDLSVQRAGLAKAEAARVASVINACGLPTTIPRVMSTGQILEAVKRDKKFSQGAIRFVLTERLGNAFVSDQVTLEEIRNAVEKLKG